MKINMLQKVMGLGALLLMLAACNIGEVGGGRNCIYADDFGNTERHTFAVDPMVDVIRNSNGLKRNSNTTPVINIDKDDFIEITVVGSISKARKPDGSPWGSENDGSSFRYAAFDNNNNIIQQGSGSYNNFVASDDAALHFGIFDYPVDDNSGYYLVTVLVTKGQSSILGDISANAVSGLKSRLLGPIDPTTGERDGGMVRDMYNAIIVDGSIIGAIRALLVLAVALMAFKYLAGMSQLSQPEIFGLIWRFGLVSLLITPDSWELFYKFFFVMFLGGFDQVIFMFSEQFITTIDNFDTVGVAGGTNAVINNIDDAEQNSFRFVDETIKLLFAKETQAKIMALFFGSFLGAFYALLLYFGIFIFLFSLIKALIVYLVSIIMVALLIIVAPIAVSCILFNYTRSVFDQWVKQFMAFSLQPLLLFMIIVIFNVFIYSIFHYIFYYHVCWGCVAEVDLPLSEKLGIADFDKFCLIYGYRPWEGAGNNPVTNAMVTPVKLVSILIFLIMVQLFSKLTSWVTSIAITLTGGGGVDLSGVAQNASQLPAQALQTAAAGVSAVGSMPVIRNTSVGRVALKYGTRIDESLDKRTGKQASAAADAKRRKALRKQQDVATGGGDDAS